MVEDWGGVASGGDGGLGAVKEAARKLTKEVVKEGEAVVCMS